MEECIREYQSKLSAYVAELDEIDNFRKAGYNLRFTKTTTSGLRPDRYLPPDPLPRCNGAPAVTTCSPKALARSDSPIKGKSQKISLKILIACFYLIVRRVFRNEGYMQIERRTIVEPRKGSYPGFSKTVPSLRNTGPWTIPSIRGIGSLPKLRMSLKWSKSEISAGIPSQHLCVEAYQELF
jgi:hypothetical protein